MALINCTFRQWNVRPTVFWYVTLFVSDKSYQYFRRIVQPGSSTVDIRIQDNIALINYTFRQWNVRPTVFWGVILFQTRVTNIFAGLYSRDLLPSTLEYKTILH